MTLESFISQLVPPGAGEVLWLDRSKVSQLVSGTPPTGVKRAIVLDNVLGLFPDRAALLRGLAGQLAGGGVIIAAVTPRANPLSKGRFSRREVLDVFAAAGYDVTSCTLIPDDRSPWRPVGLTPDGRSEPVDEREEEAAARIVVAGRRQPIAKGECSVVVVGPTPAERIDRTGVNATVMRVQLLAGETRAQAWNRGARMVSGDHLAFVDGRQPAPPRLPLGELMAKLRSTAGLAVAGNDPVGFGPAWLPAHNLPYPLATAAAGKVPAVAGAGLVIRRRLFVEVGGFDPELGAELDGPDLCLRLRARGQAVWSTAGSAPAAGQRETRGVRRFVVKWGGQVPEEPRRPPQGARKTRTTSRQPASPLLWTGPLLERSGYGEEARAFVAALHRLGIDIAANPTDWVGATASSAADLSRVTRLTTDEPPARLVNIVHSLPVARMMVGGNPGVFPLVEYFRRDPRAVLNVGRTMFETDRIPPQWVSYCNEMDEVWVPSTFNVETFSAAGVEREKLVRIPGAVDTSVFDPRVPPAHIPGAGSFVFLSVFAWSRRKGWDALVRAYLEEFAAREDVTLVLKVAPTWNRPPHRYQAEFESFIRESLGRRPGDRPRVIIDGHDRTARELARLYRAANAFVLASRGESYGRPYLEAMAMGLPTIGTRCGGNVDFMNDGNSYLTDTQLVEVPAAGVDETPDYRGHRWVEPDIASLRRAMRRVFEERAEAAARGAEARRHVQAHYTPAVVARGIVRQLERAGVRPRRIKRRESIAVEWEGPNRIAFGLAEVNREITRALQATGGMTVRASEEAVSRPWLDGKVPSVTVRHRWPPDLAPPRWGRWVMYQPWEYGSLPADWIEPINRQVDEAWVPSTYVRDSYVRSGVDPAKVAVVPYGIDPERFRPGVTPMELPTAKKTRFLFVGGTIMRKGVDVLLDAYIRTFKPSDDVSLVIKDLGSQSFYRGQTIGRRIRALQADPANPEIVYLDREIPGPQMPGLYAACTCLVHPYRGEGYGLPIAEAMACGLPVIVPNHGACLDFCDRSTAYLVKAKEVRRAEAKLGSLTTVDRGWWTEVDGKALASAMRRVASKPDAARAVGRRASRRIRTSETWDRAARIAASRIEALTKRRARITACVVARNEARTLPRCLKSLRGLADEVVVVDTGSSDRTVDVARRLGAKVWTAPWTDDFSAARNESLRHATGDWILIIDADEWLDAAGRRELREIADGAARDCHTVRQITGSAAGRAGVERTRLRFVPNRPELKFVGRAVERLVGPSGAPQQHPSGVVVHHDGSTASRRRRVKRILKLFEDEVATRPDKARLVVELSAAHLELGDAAAAEQNATKAVVELRGRRADDPARALLPDAVLLRARALMLLGRYEEAEKACRRALAVDPEFGDAYAILGQALGALGRDEAGRAAAEAAAGCLPRRGGMFNSVRLRSAPTLRRPQR